MTDLPAAEKARDHFGGAAEPRMAEWPSGGEVILPWHIAPDIADKAAFFLPYISSGMSVLDVGCGFGPITLELAAVVGPGVITGVDLQPGRIERARGLAAERGITNVTFAAADIYGLPFADDSFDAAFSHATLQSLPDQVEALRALRRVTRPGGVIGIRDLDWEGVLITAADPEVRAIHDMRVRLSLLRRDRDGGDTPGFWYLNGRYEKTWLREAGFTRFVCGASCDVEDPAIWGEQWARQLADDGFEGKQLLELGWVDAEQLAGMREAMRAWGTHQDSYLVTTRYHAVAWND